MPTQEQIVEAAARAAYDAVSALRAAFLERPRPAWEATPTRTQAPVREAARLVLLRGASPRVLHEKWLKDKLAAGWTYGDAEDPENRHHPAMVPWDDLPPSQRAKAHAFVLVARSVGSALGVERPERTAGVHRPEVDPPSGGGAE